MPTGKWTFKGTVKAANGMPVSGVVRVTPNSVLNGGTEEFVVVERSVKIYADNDGVFSAELYSSDDLGPNGWVYDVVVFPSGSPSWGFSMDPGYIGETIDLSDVVEVTPVDPQTSYLTAADIGTEDGPAGPLEGGKIPVEQISGLLDAGGVGADPAGTSAAALVAHTGAPDPHPGYLTPAEGAAAYDSIGAASGAVASHAGSGDPHGDRAFTTSAVNTHTGDSDPHGDRAFATGAVSTHEADSTNVHGIANTGALETTTGSAAKVTAHAGASDPHGDRAYIDAKDVPGTVLTDQTSITTALVDVVNMGLAITAGVWDFEYVVQYTSSVNAASGIALDLIGPANTLVAYTHLIQTSNATSSEFAKVALSSPQSGAAITTAGTSYTSRTRGRIVATASGILQLRFGCRDASTTTVVKLGSKCTAHKVA